MTIPAIPTPIASGTKAGVSTWLNSLRDVVAFLFTTTPRARVSYAGKSIPSGAVTLLSLAGSTTVHDIPGTMVDAPSSSITIRRRGWYRITTHAAWNGNTTGYRSLQVWRGASAIEEVGIQTPASAVVAHTAATLGPILCEVGDKFTLRVYQTSGTALSTAGGTYLAVSWDSIDA